MNDPTATGSLASLMLARTGRTRRFSSWDRTGRNADWLVLAPGESRVIANAIGAGVVRHLWFTVNHKDPLYLRKMVLRAWWDGETTPSIEAPLGDFFCLGHGIVKSFQNAAFNAVCHEDIEGNVGGGVALNCYFQMPYALGMQFEIENQSDLPCENFYYYVDYDELTGSLSNRRFHAQYRQEFPTTVEGGTLISRGEHYWDHMKEPNLTGDGNYTVLEANGSGHYVGCCLSVENIDPAFPVGPDGKRLQELTWWGEGDDMIFIDGELALNGTGSEDYLTQAWGMHDKAFLYGGVSIHEHDPKHPDRHALTSYRLHVLDPVVFHESIRMTIEHGHANLQENDYSSVAYWYQSEPHGEFPMLPTAAERVPRFARP